MCSDGRSLHTGSAETTIQAEISPGGEGGGMTLAEWARLTAGGRETLPRGV